MAAGLVDSLCLSMAWTVVVLEITAEHGLVAAGACSTAMLVGIALSAPAAGAMARRLDGRRLLRSAATVEATLRIAVFACLATGADVWLLALCVTAMNVVAWTGYAGMRAEVAAVSAGAVGITWYGTVVASVEAVGVAVGALLPTTADGRIPGPVLVAVTVTYVLALTPTAVVAGGSRVPRARPRPASAPRGLRRPSTASVQGSVLMMLASSPALLAVPLAAQLHGRAAVGPAAVAFTAGSLAAPALAARLDARGWNRPACWTLLAAGMLLGWVLAPWAVAWLCLAQVASGLFMTSLEGLLDARAAADHPGTVTSALATATAGRALGSSVGTTMLPLAVAAAGLGASTGTVAVVLLLAAVVVHHLSARGRRGADAAGAWPADTGTGTGAVGPGPAGPGSVGHAPVGVPVGSDLLP